MGGNILREALSEVTFEITSESPHSGMSMMWGTGGTRRSLREGEGGRGGEDAMIVIAGPSGV